MDKQIDIEAKELHIVHLDDHQIFLKGLSMLVEKRYPNCIIKPFPENTSALDYISKCFKEDKHLDLIITDYNHPGANGLLFAIQVRKLEKIYAKKTPILLLTMRWEDEELFQATKEGIFDAYFPKSAEEESLISFIKNSLLP